MAKKAKPPAKGRALRKGQVPQPPKGTKPNPENPNASAEPRKNRVRKWEKRLRRSHKQYDAWAQRFEVKRLENYYEGQQWKGLTETEAAKKYVLNMMFATVEAQLPTLLFSRPRIEVSARPSAAQTANSDITGRATLIEQLLQTLIDDPETHFTFLTTLALRDAYPRFAVMEVGYTADFIDNPNVGKPLLDEKDQPLAGDDGEPVLQPRQVLKPGTKEAIYIKRIAPQDFRCGPSRNLLDHNDWYAIAEWAEIQDVKRNPHYQNTATLKPTAKSKWEEGETEELQHDRPSLEDEDQTGKVRLWKIYDLRSKVRHVIAEGHPDYLQQDEPCPFPGHAVLKFYEKSDSFYPIPPMFNWIGPQDELNESREMARVHRRRAIRRYLRDQSMKNVEFEKLETGEDMVVATVPSVNPPPMIPLQDAPLDTGFWTQLAASKDDFAIVSGVSGEARNTPEADTATQANIVNVRQQVRETWARQQVANWLGDICRLMLLNVKEYMTLPVMVKKTLDPYSLDPDRLVAAVGEWRAIKTEEIEDLEVDIKIDVTSLSPIAEDGMRAAWNVVLGLLTNPPVFMFLFTPDPQQPNQPSPILRKTLALNGIKNDAELRTVWRIGLAVKQEMIQQQILAAAAKAGPGGAGMAGGGGAPPGMVEPPSPSLSPGEGAGATGRPAPGPSV